MDRFSYPLSNEQIARILPKPAGFRFVLLTEHYPIESAEFVANKEKPHGPVIRCYENSAVVLDAAPFKVSAGALVLSVPADANAPDDGETIRTHLFAGSAFGGTHSTSTGLPTGTNADPTSGRSPRISRPIDPCPMRSARSAQG